VQRRKERREGLKQLPGAPVYLHEGFTDGSGEKSRSLKSLRVSEYCFTINPGHPLMH
jgi:hypothetical protein